MMKASKLLNKIQKAQIIKAIQNAEDQTSGEIRIHIENTCNKDLLDRAKEVFYTLEMHETELKNGVLIYIAIHDKKVAIIGDKGIDENTPTTYWNGEVQQVSLFFKNGEFTEGLVKTIQNIGEKLKEFFPVKPTDVNELSDEISIYDN